MPDFLNEMRKGTPTSFHAEWNLKRNCVWADNTWLCSLRSFVFKILGKRKASVATYGGNGRMQTGCKAGRVTEVGNDIRVRIERLAEELQVPPQ